MYDVHGNSSCLKNAGARHRSDAMKHCRVDRTGPRGKMIVRQSPKPDERLAQDLDTLHADILRPGQIRLCLPWVPCLLHITLSLIPVFGRGDECETSSLLQHKSPEPGEVSLSQTMSFSIFQPALAAIFQARCEGAAHCIFRHGPWTSKEVASRWCKHSGRFVGL